MAIIEKHADGFPRRKIPEGSATWIDPFAADVVPRSRSAFANAVGLARGQDDEFDAVSCKGLEGLGVDSGFGEPHAFRRSSKTMFEVGNTPFHLRDFVPCVCQRENHVVVGLSQRGTVAREFFLAGLVRFEQSLVSFGCVRL